MKTHVTWSIEKADKCPDCGGDPILIITHHWDIVDASDEEYDGVHVEEEVTAHYCRKCDKIVSLSLNT